MRALAIVVVVFLVGAIGYALVYPTLSYRFRITLNVETPDGVKAGSSVMEVRHRQYPAWISLGNNTGESSLSGDAIFVNLGADNRGKPRNLFGLLALGQQAESIDFYQLPGKAFEPLWRRQSAAFRGAAEEVAKLPVGTKVELSSDQLPTLLTFSDISDPASGRLIAPDEFSTVFGAGVRLQSATIEIVPSGNRLGIGGEPITRGVARHLPWWDEPLPWLKSSDGRVFVDTRTNGFKWNKSHFERGG